MVKVPLLLLAAAGSCLLSMSAACAVGPLEYRSRNVVLKTDLPASEARLLLARLETILGLVSKYWDRPLDGQIECRVVQDLAAWPDGTLSELGRAKIAAGTGITTTQAIRRGGQFVSGRSIVHSTADGGTPQHEIVHAYCGQTFGRTGPLWYSEGMAEVGQFWQPGDAAVRCKPHIIEYLNRQATRSIAQIVADDAPDGQSTGAARTGDSWQAYACRWALCHLLVHNDNYRDRFRALGLAYLAGATTSFEQAFAPVLDQLEFEYQQFVRNVTPGYRVDLCRWDWQHKFREPAAAPITARVAAKRGWQPSGVLVERGQRYRYTAAGQWKLASGDSTVTAAGDSTGNGRLAAVVLRDFVLSEPIALSTGGTFVAPSSGQLYLRCREDWGELADNSGALTVKISATTEGPQAPGPADAASLPASVR